MDFGIAFYRKIKISLTIVVAVMVLTFSVCVTGKTLGEKPDEFERTTDRTPVSTGIDILERDNFSQLAAQRIGLITNHTGKNRSGISNIQLFHQSPAVKLVAIFSPEHGLLGKLDIPEIENSRDTLTNIEVFSLYGNTRKPTGDMLRGIDTLVFDIQDIGTRFYTYISTMGLAMQAAAENNIRFLVLDRPNPINGLVVSGPVLDEGRQSFVGFHRLPVRHGMTIGELALMFKAELELDLDLNIVEIENWSRADYFDKTGLRWINPSPNMRSLTEAILYPGVGLLETTNLTVGRGTATPFEWFGAPWLDAALLAERLQLLKLPGVEFEPVTFTPDSSKFEGQMCRGIRLRVTKREAFNSVRTGIEIAIQLRRFFPDLWEIEKYDRLLGNKAVLDGIREGRSYSEIEAIYRGNLLKFKQRRVRYLIYE